MEEFKEAQAKIESPGLQVRVKKPDIGAKISRCMVIRGEVKSCEPIVIDGTLYGDIISDDSVIIQKSGIVFGKIRAKAILVEGKIEGPLEANSIEVAKGAILTGYILAYKIQIAGSVDGDVVARELLVVDEGAEVSTYECQAKVMIIKGAVSGKVLAKSLLDIRSSGSIEGDIRVKELKTQGGSTIFGTISRFESSSVKVNSLPINGKKQESEKESFKTRRIG